MDYAALVGVLHRAGECFAEACRVCGRKRPLADLLRQVAAADEFHREKRPALGLANFVNLHDIGVLQPGDRFRLHAKAGLLGGVGVAAGQDHLDRDHALERDLTRLINDTHAPTPQLRQHLVPRHDVQHRPCAGFGRNIRRGACGIGVGHLRGSVQRSPKRIVTR